MLLSLMSFYSLFAQSKEKIVFEFYQAKEYHIIFPCKDLSTCIDTLYYKGDTIVIKLVDNRVFSLASNKRQLNCTGTFYTVKAKKFKRQLNIPTVDSKYTFIKMQIYDEIYLFKKGKNRYILEDVHVLKNEIRLEILRENSISVPIPTVIEPIRVLRK